MKFGDTVFLAFVFCAQLIASTHASDKSELEIQRCEFACPYEA